VRAIKQFSSGALSSFAQQQQKIWEFLKWAGTFIVCVPSEKV
jgi:predicted secreted protein